MLKEPQIYATDLLLVYDDTILEIQPFLRRVAVRHEQQLSVTFGKTAAQILFLARS